MLETLLHYCAAEKRESLLFIVIGAAALLAGIILWRSSSAFAGAAYPLIAIAIIQIVVGSTVYFRTDGQVATLSAQLASDPHAFRAEELARMDKVMRSFRLYKILEIAFIVGAIILILAFRAPSIGAGIGLGLLLQASVMLTADIVAEHRADLYIEGVRAVSR